MKRVRTEQLQTAVSCYLKRRQYVDSDGPLKQGLRLSQSAEEMAANLSGDAGPLRAAWSRTPQLVDALSVPGGPCNLCAPQDPEGQVQSGWLGEGAL